MVQFAEGQPVWHTVRATVRVPLDVGRIESEQIVVEPDIEITDCAATLIGGQDSAPEVGVAFAPSRRRVGF